MSRLILRYTLSWLLIAAILTVCFIPVPETPVDNVPFIDKWVHIVMYFVLSSSLWIEYLRSHVRINYKKLGIGAILLPILMSGLIELLQAYCTETRSGDWMDFLANSLGVALAALAGFGWYRRRFLKKKAA